MIHCRNCPSEESCEVIDKSIGIIYLSIKFSFQSKTFQLNSLFIEDQKLAFFAFGKDLKNNL